ncbi:ABC transporter permease [Paenarthrobacter histidinolovorans]|uniref:ABC-type nitrate/sulfonate/bicarbonate transport system permease component n=1 Tax=Paenarthrobacter histidinolovorans TaxID=43664 RepID=A0ABW8N771_9MICC
MRIAKSILFVIALPALLVLMWWVFTLSSKSFFVPTPGSLAATFAKTWFGDHLFSDVLPSILRLFAGVAVAIVLGILAGLVIGSVRWLRALTEPVLEFFRAVPPPVLVPVLMLLMGISDSMKVVVIISGCIWPVLLNTIEGVRAIDGVLSDSARTYGIGSWARVRYLVLPSAGPQILAGVRQCLSIGLILMVISEMFASSSGLGFTIVQFQRSFAVPEMWSGIVILGLIGVAMSFIFQFTERRILRWYHGLREVENAV